MTIGSAENSFIEIYKLFVMSKYKEALKLCGEVPEPDNASFLIQNLKANIQAKIGGYGMLVTLAMITRHKGFKILRHVKI